MAWSPRARVLGFGTASFLMAPIAIYARWFPPDRFSTFAGIQLGLGSLGAIFATAPLAYATASFGWRMTFLGVGVCAALIGVLVWLIVTDDPPGVKHTPRKETLRESIAGIWQVIRTPSMGRVFMMQLSIYPSYVLVVGLWGGPYLTHIYGYDLKGRGDILFVAALARRAGLVLVGAERAAVRPLQGSGDARRRDLLCLPGAAWPGSARCRCRCCSSCSRRSAFRPEWFRC